MPDDQKHVYREGADEYEALVSREDYQGHILAALRELVPLTGADVLDLGAGTGRMTMLLVPFVRSLLALDLSPHMLAVARDRLTRAGFHHGQAAAADHRALPVPSGKFDLIVSGWSVCYLKVWNPATWERELERAYAEMCRVLRPGGRIVILETLGTGHAEPVRQENLAPYFEWLEAHHFASCSIRTDYRFDSLEQAEYLARFFFGEDLARQVLEKDWIILPECTGIWWKQV
jgi:ubiquinone/menaquinone biosynthesis C-methylase UbiE